MTGDATVLVVDDEPDLAELYTAFLEPRYEVLTATSGTEALEIASPKIDVALLDRRIPDLSGDEILHGLREEGIDAKVAMLTGVEPDSDIVELPFDDYKVKPVGRTELLGVIETLLRRASYDEQSQRFFSLVAKKAALEIAGNDDTHEYEELIEQLSNARTRIDATLDEVSAAGAFN